jgi:hypothetical protein
VKGLSSNVVTKADGVVVELRDERPEAVALFAGLDAAAAERLTDEAWLLGLRAVGRAHLEAREARLEDIGTDLLAKVDRRMGEFLGRQQGTMATELGKAASEGQRALRTALDPVSEDGPVARFLRTLRSELKKADETRERQLSTALAALNPGDDKSLIVKLVRETEEARRELLRAVNPKLPGSPMAALTTELAQRLGEQATSQSRFQERVLELMVRADTRKREEDKTPRGGIQFEAAVTAFITSAAKGIGCLVEETGARSGARSRSRKGDLVVTFTAESAFEGAAVVFEAKRDASYTVPHALRELDEARKNRKAAAGVFVLARSRAPQTFPPFARFGSNVVVTWDEEDPATDPWLHAAVTLGLFLVTRARATSQDGQEDALGDLDERIDELLARMARIAKSNEAIRRGSDAIADEVRACEHTLQALLGDARRALEAKAVPVRDEQAERRKPLVLRAAGRQVVANRTVAQAAPRSDRDPRGGKK